MRLAQRLYCHAATILVRPYIRRELPGWGFLYRALIGDYRRNWLWRDFGVRQGRDKLHGALLDYDMASWANRVAYFLGRHVDLELQTVAMTVLRPGDTFVDIGANEGVFSLLAASIVGSHGEVIAFEPNPQPRSILEKHLRRNGLTVDIRAKGLSDEPGVLEMFVPAINSGEGTFGAAPYDEGEGHRIKCPVSTGDVELEGKRPRLIKIDVEGHEMQVIGGLTRVIAGSRPLIMVEMIDSHLRRSGSSATELSARFEQMGYEGRRIMLNGPVGRKQALFVADNADGDYLWFPSEAPPAIFPSLSIRSARPAAPESRSA